MNCIIITYIFFLLSVRDVVPGYRITIVRTNADEVYYFGRYNGQDYRNPTRLNGNLYPRDLMARGLGGQWSSGAVSLECDNDEIAVTDETAGTTGNSYVVDMSSKPSKSTWTLSMSQHGWGPSWIW